LTICNEPTADSDETEAEILTLLGDGKPYSYNEIVEHVGRKISASSPKIARRLRHLVKIDRIQRKITDDWPPRSLYSIRIKESRARSTIFVDSCIMSVLILFLWIACIYIRGDLLLINFIFFSAPIVVGVYAGLVNRNGISALYTCLVAAGMVVVLWTIFLYLDYLLIDMLQAILYVYFGIFMLETIGTIMVFSSRIIWKHIDIHNQRISRVKHWIRNLLST